MSIRHKRGKPDWKQMCLDERARRKQAEDDLCVVEGENAVLEDVNETLELENVELRNRLAALHGQFPRLAANAN